MLRGIRIHVVQLKCMLHFSYSTLDILEFLFNKQDSILKICGGLADKISIYTLKFVVEIWQNMEKSKLMKCCKVLYAWHNINAYNNYSMLCRLRQIITERLPQ